MQIEKDRLQSDLARAQDESRQLQQRFSEQLAAHDSAYERSLNDAKARIARMREEHDAAMFAGQQDHDRAVERLQAQSRDAEVSIAFCSIPSTYHVACARAECIVCLSTLGHLLGDHTAGQT